MLEWISRGGVIMYILIFSSLLAIAVVLERFAYFRKVDQKKRPFLNEFHDTLDVYQIEATEELCKSNPGPLATIAMTGLGAADRSRAELKEVLEEAGSREVPNLEAYLPILSTVAYISPLLGLLGTVLGLIGSFQSLQEATLQGSQAGIGIFAGGIWKALITTVAGLTIGITIQVLHNYLFTQKERLINELENASHELLEILCEKFGRNPS